MDSWPDYLDEAAMRELVANFSAETYKPLYILHHRDRLRYRTRIGDYLDYIDKLQGMITRRDNLMKQDRIRNEAREEELTAKIDDLMKQLATAQTAMESRGEMEAELEKLSELIRKVTDKIEIPGGTIHGVEGELIQGHTGNQVTSDILRPPRPLAS